jgi:hemerythrin superfamily protein
MQKSDNWLVHDHRKYEAALRDCEIAAGAGDWDDAVKLFYDFVDDLKLHMRMEDEVVYPFIREEVGDPDDEIGELVEEHETLVRLLTDLATIIRHNDFDHFEESLSPLYKAIVEHNSHEEEVLSRMGSESLLTQRDKILHQLDVMAGSGRVWQF